jgi:hypothetical protein
VTPSSDTYDMDPVSGQPAITTTPLTMTPPPAAAQHIELQVLPAAMPTTTELPPGNGDPDDPEENEVLDASLPLGVKLTAYRLLNLVVLLAIGLAKFISSLNGQSVAPSGLEWVGGSVLAAL